MRVGSKLHSRSEVSKERGKTTQQIRPSSIARAAARPRPNVKVGWLRADGLRLFPKSLLSSAASVRLAFAVQQECR
jgi:hypothetical protein